MIKKISVLIFAAMVLGSCSHTDTQEKNKVLSTPFTTVAKGYNSLEKFQKEIIIKTKTELEGLWDTIYAAQSDKPALPAVDFESEIIVAVFMGEKPTAGYGIEIEKIMENGKVTVSVKHTLPPPDGFSAQVITEPYHIVKIPNTSKSIVFERQ